MEASNRLIKKAIDDNFLRGCKNRGRGREVYETSYFLYVDYILVFCEASEDYVAYSSRILMWFEARSNVKVNL